ncbi:uncharacterized protein LOC103310064 [Acyrthosiphon pisum]|uniref:Zinc finger MYM-type protein 1-like n=1 Tax=Acyrthosiphon pisum TaxID=7029 RepID=A0A8R2H5W5_ACYPI|nr:uncharacterized protein LOC103310064 [Acyrthosiphon pisum]|eukprot:XP_016661805.1 PREDICTED: uncharacterized protein LOC103310064 [Acyrthosiphon pisum]
MSSKKPSGSWFAKQRLKKEKESKKLAKDINKWLISETINANNVVVAPPELEPSGISSNHLNISDVESEQIDNVDYFIENNQIDVVVAPPELEPSGISSNHLNISEVESEQIDNVDYFIENNQIDVVVAPLELEPSGISSNHLNISEVESEQIDNVDYFIENNQIDIDCNINFKDPGTWPPITSSIRTLLVEKGPQHYEPKNVPSDDKGRHFSKKWFYRNLSNGERVRRQWLMYSELKNSVFCFPCLLFSNDNRTCPFLNNGFDDWQHLNPYIPDHEKSKSHLNNFISWKELEKRIHMGVTIDCEFEKTIEKEKEKWRNILRIIIDVILFCSKNNLALRGTTEKIGDLNSGIFLQLIELISHYSPILAQHVHEVKQSNFCTSYFSPTIQNEIIVLLGQTIRNKIITSIKEAKYYGIMFDCTPDISHKEQMSQIIRYVKIDNTEISIEESFVDFIQSREKTGTGLASEILKKLEEDGIELKNCRAQGYDNGANMAGKYNGVQAVICRQNELATFIPCAAHSLNRIGVHAAETSPTMISFFGTVQKVFNFFSSSVSRWEKLTSVLKVTLKSHSDTRWSSKKRAVSAINQNITQVYEILQCMSNDESLSADTMEGAKCLLRLFNFKIFILLDIWDLILTQIDLINCSLQSKNQTVDTASFMLKGLISSIMNIRNNGLEISINKAKATASFLNIPSHFEEKRSKIIKRRFDDSPNDEPKLRAEQELNRECYLAMDSIISNFSRRYEQMNKVVSDFGFLTGNKLFNMKSEDVLKWSRDLAMKYSDDLNGFDLYSELECFKNQAYNLMDNFKSATPLELLKFIHKYSLKDVYPNIEIALRIFLTIPVTTATCERSFSKLKIIKNYLRSTMSQDRLTNMGIISIERELASKINFEDIIDEFATKKARKVKF